MRLRTIELVGFKSFRDHVEIEISDGMTCIVGPNGCGKSNVVDAIKWAMGDMSPKSLRGSSMSDVIFAGTEKLKPAGMAEVTLTFENTAVTRASESGTQTQLDELIADSVEGGWPGDDDASDDVLGGDDDTADTASANAEVATEADWELGDSIPRQFRGLPEIAITRRLHRSGESEYLINKVDCRLRDIRSLLAGTGLGKQGYSIIEQGQIGFIVNARPSERRLIIEEASGITRYKDRRKRAERKLERTEQNLQRIRDVLDEIQGRMQSLQVQAEKAREHRALSRELEGLEVALLLDRRGAASSSVEKLKHQLKSARAQVESKQQTLKAAKTNLEKAKKAAEDADKRHADITENFYKAETRLNLARSNRDHARDARRQASERREDLLEDRVRQKQRRRDLSDELKELRQTLKSLDDRPKEAVSAIESLEETLTSLRQRRAQLVKQRDSVRTEISNQNAEVQRIEDRLNWIDEQIEELSGRQAGLRDSRDELVEQRDEIKRGLARLRIDHERAGEAVEDGQRRVAAMKETLEQMRGALDETVEREEDLARRRLALKARIDSLEELRRQGEGYADGVRLVLEWARETNRDDILGPLGDFLEVPAGQEGAYAAFFGERLGDILVRDRNAAQQAIEMVIENDGARVGCVPLPDTVEGPEKWATQWMERLEVVPSFDDVPTAGDERQARPESGWATPAGVAVFSDGRIVGGKSGDAGETALRQARQLDALREQLSEVVEAHDEALEVLEIARDEVDDVARRLEQAQEALREKSHEQRGLKQELASEQRELDRAESRLERLGDEIDEVTKEGHRLDEERQSRESCCDEIVEAMPDLESKLAQAQGELEAVEAQIEELNKELTDHKVKVAQADERKRHLQERVQRSQTELSRAKAQIERIGKEIEEQEVRAKEAQMRAETLAKEVERLETLHQDLGTEVEDVKGDVEELTEQVKSMELLVLGHRQDLEELQDAVQELELAKREAQLEIDHVTEQLDERFELDLPKARRIAAECETPADERKVRAKTLKGRLRRIGEVNALAIEEYEEIKERHRFESEQRDDLEESVADLREAIERMDWESRKRFRETFNAINEQFETVFPRLFRGGQARLILTEPDDLLNTGVDIEVQPPGKKLQNVSLLSGGEKALTAVSLIFSIFLLKPSPFAVLDEVDAPLDDANVGRFADMVRELSELSQMLVITHNRRTMEAPEKLYGVTMQEAGISKVVSVSLSELEDRLAS